MYNARLEGLNKLTAMSHCPETLAGPPAYTILDVRAFLRFRLQQVAPGALLTHAWDAFYQTYDAVLRRFAVARGVRGSDADDLVQEVWVRVIKKLPELKWNENQSGLRAWLCKVVHDKAVDLARRHRHRSADNLDEGVPQPSGKENDPAALLEECWERETVDRLLKELATEIRDENLLILRLHYSEGRSVPEIAEALGRNTGQVSARIHRVLAKLRNRVAAYTGTTP